MPLLKHMSEQEPATAVPEPSKYTAPRIDLKLLTIVVHPNPYSRRTPLARSRKPILRRRWSS